MIELKPTFGLNQLLFGMKENNVKSLYGHPNLIFKDEDENVIWVYNELKMRLTFYEEEDLRLGYIICSHSDATLFGYQIIGKSIEEIQPILSKKGINTFEKEAFDIQTNFFNEDNWIIFQEEFGEIVKIEMGAVVKNLDEFDWKFKA